MLTVEHIHKTYQQKPLLTDLSLTVQPGETVCLLGASGSGKSTLLRMIAGIESPDSGDIRWQGQSILPLPIHQRHFGLMFQDYALFPHLNVLQNVSFGLRMQHFDPDQTLTRAEDALRQVGMLPFSQRHMEDLSGGEQQRVALARTLAARPRLLMLDEPLAALDRSLRAQLLTEIRQILAHTGIPAIYVTHDQQEACMIADRILLLGGGHILQAGAPEELFTHPRSVEVAGFLGLKNILTGRIASIGAVILVDTALGPIQVDPDTGQNLIPGQAVTLLLRQAILAPVDSAGALVQNRFSAQVDDAYFQEDGYLVSLHIGADRFSFLLPGYQPGQDRIQFSLPATSIQIFPGS
jgi:ABC-type Fe3+/spermidine/putrescine transport system ATPase subunit